MTTLSPGGSGIRRRHELGFISAAILRKLIASPSGDNGRSPGKEALENEENHEERGIKREKKKTNRPKNHLQISRTKRMSVVL